MAHAQRLDYNSTLSYEFELDIQAFTYYLRQCDISFAVLYHTFGKLTIKALINFDLVHFLN